MQKCHVQSSSDSDLLLHAFPSFIFSILASTQLSSSLSSFPRSPPPLHRSRSPLSSPALHHSSLPDYSATTSTQPIGKGGETIARLRDSFQIKAGVSKVVQGVQDRVLTVTGGVEGVVNVSSPLPRPGETAVFHPFLQVYACIELLKLGFSLTSNRLTR